MWVFHAGVFIPIKWNAFMAGVNQMSYRLSTDLQLREGTIVGQNLQSTSCADITYKAESLVHMKWYRVITLKWYRVYTIGSIILKWYRVIILKIG